MLNEDKARTTAVSTGMLHNAKRRRQVNGEKNDPQYQHEAGDYTQDNMQSSFRNQAKHWI